MTEERAGHRDGPVVGIDAGGTGSRVLVLRGPDVPPIRREGPAAAVDPRAPARSARILVKWLRGMAVEGALTLPAVFLCAGIAGARRPQVRKQLEREFEAAGVSQGVLIQSDGEVALHDAHGAGAGLLLVAGTGSVAWGRDASGRIARAGGWGPLLGDEGSAHAIARDALCRITRSADGREPATPLAPGILDWLGLSRVDELVEWTAGASRAEIAALAPEVIGLATRGVRPATKIVENAVGELVRAVEAVRRRLSPWAKTPEVALTGGLLEPGRPLRGRVLDRLSRFPVTTDEKQVEPERGAARLALREAGWPDRSRDSLW